jgi:hypothetical protein
MSTAIKSNAVKLPYYNYDRLFSYNAKYNTVCGGRGLGKTFGAKEQGIRNFLRRGEQFIYLRRYKDELAAAKNTFFADITFKFPDEVFRIHGREAQWMDPDEKDDKGRPVWKTMGYFLALSTAQSQKSVAFPLVTLIIFDEFIIEKGNIHYLPNEATAFNNFYSTVDRWKDKTKVLFLANSVSIDNPYFIAWGIRPAPEIKRYADGFIICDFPEATDFADAAYQTEFGRFIAGTEYADYALGNQFSDNHDNLVKFKTSAAHYIYTLEVSAMSFSVWQDGNQYYCQTKLPKVETVFTMFPHRMSDGKTLMLPNDKLLQYLRSAFRHGRVVFDEPKTRNAFLEIFKK